MNRFRLFAFLIAFIAVIAAISTRSHPAAQTPAEHGKAVYDAHCVECHGESGRGDGPASGQLKPRPRDFTSGRYKIRSTETGTRNPGTPCAPAPTGRSRTWASPCWYNAKTTENIYRRL